MQNGRTRSAAVVVALATGAVAHTGMPVATETVHACYPDAQGNLTGRTFEMPLPEVTRQRMAGGVLRGAADNRVDLVFVGDGYTAGEQGQFHDDVALALSQLFVFEPFKAYEPYFRVHAIEVVSAESGVDNDPSQGVQRDTALDMGFWCGGTERLLCVNVNKAYAFANLAPAVDQVIALANSSKYGGAGYTSSDLATSAGRNASAPQVAIHELGHSMGNLADEYDYGGPQTWAGGEPSSRNASIYAASQMGAEERKWHRWLGYTGDARFDGPVGTYEGCNYSVLGIYRPSNNSMMRNLNRKFNAPGAERMVRAVYVEVDPVDDHAPNDGPVEAGGVVWVAPMQPVGHDLEVSWFVDGAPVVGAEGLTTLDLGAWGIAGPATVVARVVDPTDMVRDESIRANFLTQEVAWTVAAAVCPADCDGSGVLSLDDVDCFAAAFLGNLPAGDCDANGMWTLDDVDCFIASFAAGCP